MVQAICTGLRRYAAFRLALPRRDRPAHAARRAPAAAALRVPRPGADRPADGAREHRHPADQPGRAADPADDREHVDDGRGRRSCSCCAVPVLALFALGALPLLNIAATRFTPPHVSRSASRCKRSSPTSRAWSRRASSGVRVVKGFGAERLQERNLAAEADAVYDRSMDQARLRADFLPLIDFLPTLGLVGILWYGGHQVLDGNLTVGDIVASNFYVLMLIWPLRMVGMLLGQLSRVGRVRGPHPRGPRHRARDRRRTPRAAPLPAGPGRGRRSRASRSATARVRPVLDGLDLEIRGGEAVALVGATASGKTTVARLIPRFYDVDRRSRPHRRRRRARGAAARPAPRGRASCSRTRSSSPTRCAATSRSPIPKRRRSRSCARRGSRAPTSSSRPARRLRHRHRRARLLALGRSAAAHRDRACGARRPAHPDPRRRDVVGRPDQGARDPQRARAK